MAAEHGRFEEQQQNSRAWQQWQQWQQHFELSSTETMQGDTVYGASQQSQHHVWTCLERMQDVGCNVANHVIGFYNTAQQHAFEPTEIIRMGKGVHANKRGTNMLTVLYLKSDETQLYRLSAAV